MRNHLLKVTIEYHRDYGFSVSFKRVNYGKHIYSVSHERAAEIMIYLEGELGLCPFTEFTANGIILPYSV